MLGTSEQRPGTNAMSMIKSNTFGYGARPRRLRDSIVGFMTKHGLLFNADKLRS